MAALIILWIFAVWIVSVKVFAKIFHWKDVDDSLKW